MQSRIEIFKEAANEVLDWTPAINNNIQHLLHWPSLARQFSGWLVPNLCIISRATPSTSASQNTTATVRISSRPGGSEAEMLELDVCLVYDPDIIKTMWHLTPTVRQKERVFWPFLISHLRARRHVLGAGSWTSHRRNSIRDSGLNNTWLSVANQPPICETRIHWSPTIFNATSLHCFNVNTSGKPLNPLHFDGK